MNVVNYLVGPMQLARILKGRLPVRVTMVMLAMGCNVQVRVIACCKQKFWEKLWWHAVYQYNDYSKFSIKRTIFLRSGEENKYCQNMYRSDKR